MLIGREPQGQQAKCRASSRGNQTAVASCCWWVRSCVRPATQASEHPIRRLKQTGKPPPDCYKLVSPHPPQGGYNRPSNIMRDYAQPSRHTRPKQQASAAGWLCASPHNQHYIKWPRRSCSIRCAAKNAARKSESIPTHQGCLALAAPAHANCAWSSVPAKPSQPTLGKSKSQRGIVPSQWQT